MVSQLNCNVCARAVLVCDYSFTGIYIQQVVWRDRERAGQEECDAFTNSDSLYSNHFGLPELICAH